MNRRANGRSPKPGGPPRLTLVSDTDPDSSPDKRLSLSRLDWIALACVAVILLIAPLWVSVFATPAQTVVFTADALALEGPLALTLQVWTGPLVLVLAAAAFCLLAWREWKRPVAIGAVPGLAAAFGVLGVWAIISAVRSPVAYLSLNALSCLLAALLLGGIVSRLGRDRQAVSALALTIALAGSIVAALGVREYLGELREGVLGYRTFSTFLNPDFLAGYLLLTLPVTLSAFAAASGRVLRLSVGIGLALQSGCLFLTGSRAGTAIALVTVLCWAGIALIIGRDPRRRRWIALGGAIFVAASALSATPTLARFGGEQAPAPTAAKGAARPAEDAQAHSGEFRKYTWMGTVRMAMRNPVTGTGIGTFATAYPKYSDTAFTAHAHNSFLQWAGETGLPGAIALVTALAAAAAFIVHAMMLFRARPAAEDSAVDTPGTTAQLASPGLLLAGFVASLIAVMLHSIFDSDLYIVSTLLTFSAIFALTVAQARDIASLTTQTPRPLARELWALGLIVCTFLLIRGGQVGFSRWYRGQVNQARSTFEAINRARLAAGADPFDPEPHFILASLQAGSPEEVQELRQAARLAPTGMTYYLLGRHYRDAGQWKDAIDAFERARASDPHNLQALKALADAQRAAKMPEQARFTFQTMTALETSPFGTVRATPELIETDFAYAHAGLGDMALDDRHPDGAHEEYTKARKILSRYWETRTWLVNQWRQPEKRRALAALYEDVLRNDGIALKQLGRNEEMALTEKELNQLEADKRADDEKTRASGG